ncbi:family 20 glycosylhydrolase [Enterococcus hirae]
MVDLSRNAVMTVDQLEHFFVLCSKMGLNSCMLYMEDTYQIPDYPYFGYCRGAYSLEELKALDAFAETVGIELIPCIQTLAHLTNPLKWGFANGMRDTSDILLVEEEKTYQFLDRAISVIAAAFKTSKIHIGMDEAHDLGRGHYLTQHGLIDRFDIMEKHLKKVMEI